MERKIWIGIGVLVVVLLILSFFIFLYRPAPTREQLLKKFEEFERKSQEMKEMGYNFTEAEGFAKRAWQAFNRKDYIQAEEFLRKAFESLEKARKILVIPEEVKEASREKLRNIRVAVVYESVTDYRAFNRSLNDVVQHLKSVNADFVFRGFWVWGPCAERCSDLPEEVLNIYEERGFDCERQGYYYAHLRDVISSIKGEMPDIIFCSGIPAQRTNFIEIDPITNKIYEKDEVEEMALDPSKLGMTTSKEELQRRLQNTMIGAGGYFPDITNPEFQKLLLDKAKKQIDAGADAIWIDMLFSQARILAKLTGDPYHPAVRESYEASSKIIDEIHRYGYEKYRRYIYVGTWWTFLELPYSTPDVDFITVSPLPEEVERMSLNDSRLEDIIKKAKNLKSVTILAFIDWGTEHSPMVVFSQKLEPEKQKEFLVKANQFFASKGIVFAYPLHGGFMGKSAKKLSFNKWNIYDSLAPEFQIFETVKELSSIRY